MNNFTGLFQLLSHKEVATLNTPENTSKKMKSISNVIFLLLFGYVVFEGVPLIMYSKALYEFSDDDSFSEYIRPNGMPVGYKSLAPIIELRTTSPKFGEGSVEDWCPGISSDRGHVTMGFVEDDTDTYSVCCWASSHQLLVPYKDVGSERLYMCGEWPHIDIARQKIKAAEAARSSFFSDV